jgi:hypothetical protein
MDRFTKAVLAVIAFALCAIAAKMWEVPAAANAQGAISGAPTVGQFQDAQTVEQRAALVRRIPVVRVHGQVGIN